MYICMGLGLRKFDLNFSLSSNFGNFFENFKTNIFDGIWLYAQNPIKRAEIEYHT